ncbi:MAG: peptidylprolyl isomerase [Hylemonella sp.]|nr:peptidylprolyl isomerase [Hylemonella sp.]MDP1938361.1 peptidylprolyl isomerase [Hylemonella sp.]
MIFRVSALSAAFLLIFVVPLTHAQGLRSAVRTAPAVSAVPVSAQGAVRQADFIVTVVNSEPITNHDVAVEVQRAQQQYAQQRQVPPDTRELTRQVLEKLINEKAQLQLARESGIKVDEPSVDQAEQSVAMQNQLSVDELRRRVAQDGINPKQFRDQLRNQLLLTRLREREVEPRVRVSDLEVDQYLQEQLANSNVPANQQINIAQLLVAVPDNASEVQLVTLQAKAQRALERARAGEDFATLARELSDAADRTNGGQLGLRPADRYPPLFLDATKSLAVGGISGLVRSGAGFHVLKLVEKRNAGLPPVVITQSRARHILLRPSAQLSEAAARDKLNDFRRRIQAGQTDFATLARQNSQDGSAEQGGDLGWAYPGQFVPEFEAVMNRLAPGQIGEPLISRFGVHLIQLLERRNTTLSEREQREMVRNMLREKKLDEAYANWVRDVRARAYVEMREPPQ